jgi:hypothetical protein
MLDADTDVGAERADMSTDSHAARADARARADGTDIGGAPDLRHGGAGQKHCACKC